MQFFTLRLTKIHYVVYQGRGRIIADDIVQSTVNVSYRLLLHCQFHAQLFDLIIHFGALFVFVRYAQSIR